MQKVTYTSIFVIATIAIIFSLTLKEPTKSYVAYNKANLVLKPGAYRIKAAHIFTALGASSVEELDGLNAVSFEAPASSSIRAFESGDWVIQEQVSYHISMGSPLNKCYSCPGVLTEVSCPVETPVPSPEPVPAPSPSPSPSPVPSPPPSPVPPGEVSVSWGLDRVRALEAKKVVDTSKVKVCVVDTGIDTDHPNRGNILGTASYAGANVEDRQGHGTHTAGTIAGLNGVGVSRAGLLVCKGLGDDGSGSSASLAQCLQWCGSQGAQIVSNSWGSTQSDQFINQAVKALTDRGVYVFFATGNDSGPVNWPAKLSGSNPLVYAVAASNERDQIAQFSSRGPEVKFIEPGEDIISNWPGGGQKNLSGTSMATPHASGICAYGVARGIKPCIKTKGTISGYNFGDALTTARD